MPAHTTTQLEKFEVRRGERLDFGDGNFIARYLRRRIPEAIDQSDIGRLRKIQKLTRAVRQTHDDFAEPQGRMQIGHHEETLLARAIVTEKGVEPVAAC